MQLMSTRQWVEKHSEGRNSLGQTYARGKQAKKNEKMKVSYSFTTVSPSITTTSLQGRTTQFQNGEELAFLDAWLMAIHRIPQKLHKEPWLPQDVAGLLGKSGQV